MRSERKPARRSLSEKVAAKAANHQSGRNRSSYLLLPDGVETFKPKKEGTYRFNIVPYVAGKNNRDSEPGELDYEFTFFIHKVGEGDDQRTIVCPKKTYGKPCPICEQVERLSKDYVENEDEIKALKAKQRQLFNIVDARDEENRIQVYETSYFKGFGEMLDKRLRNFDDEDDENYGDFADIPGGRTLKVMFAEDTFNGNKFFAPSSIDFVPRKEELPDSIIDEAVCLDSCLKVLSYNDILKLIAGTEDEEQEETTVETRRRPVRGSKPAAKPEPEEEDEKQEEEKTRKPAKLAKPAPVEEDNDNEEEEEEKPVKASKIKEKRKPVQEDPDEDDEDASDEEEEEKPRKSTTPDRGKRSQVEEEEDDDEDDEDDEEEPVKPVKKAKKPSKPEPEDDEDDEDDEEEPEFDKHISKKIKDEEQDEEEEEKPRKPAKKVEKEKPSKKGGKCPHGYVWGADCYVYSECDDCELCEQCDAAQEDK